MAEAYQMPHIESVRSYAIRHFEIPEEIQRIRLFHGTSTVFLPRILEQGLVDSHTSGEMIDDGDWASKINLVYLGHPRRCLGEYATRTVRKRGGQRILVEVEVPVDYRLEEDSEEIRGCFTDWRKSLEHFLICAYRGSLTPQHTVAIHFFTPSWGLPIQDMITQNPQYYRRVASEDFATLNIDEVLKALDPDHESVAASLVQPVPVLL